MTSFNALRPNAPIGVFDSGVGGLSVLQALRAALPGEDIIYLADSAHAPYGERSHEFIEQRTVAIGLYLRQAFQVKLLVVACNTATAVGVHALRSAHPGWPVVALEPALRTAAQRTRTGHAGVLATRATVSSAKYAELKRAVAAEFHGISSIDIACDGLAAAIEEAALTGNDAQARNLLERYLSALGPIGTHAGAIDTIVLGCTHYPLLSHAIESMVGHSITLVESGPPVARQAARLLHATGLLRYPVKSEISSTGQLTLVATGTTATLQAAAQRWLGVERAQVMQTS